eukprot:gene28463-31611_t
MQVAVDVALDAQKAALQQQMAQIEGTIAAGAAGGGGWADEAEGGAGGGAGEADI